MPGAHPVKHVPILCVVHVEEVGALPLTATDSDAVAVPSPIIPLPVRAAASLPAAR